MVPCTAICPYNCTCDDEAYVVRCATSNIDVLPLTFNPALQQLTMYGTEIHTLDINSFHWYQDLRHVNLSKNMIMQVRPETFRNQQHLEELHLAENNIANITADMFLGLTNLIVLSLRGNAIESLEGRIFRYLKLLRDLDLSENRIHKLEDDALGGLTNLRVLHLQSNKLHAIPALNLELVPDLAELSLGGNEFTTIQESDFQAMRTLKDLNLSGASLDGALSLASFRGLSGLRKLNLENCGLTSVPSIPLGILGQLEELHIGQNLFVTLPTDVLRNNRNLRSLFVSRCPYLLDVQKNVLEHNLHIKKVVITTNPQLTYIAADALRFLPELRLLDLRNNNLHQISERSASWSDIEEWHLEGNPISCNCSVSWLRTLLLTPNSSGKVVCGSPRSLAGVPLRSTQMNDLACSLNLATLGLVIGVVVSGVVVVIAAVVVVMLYRHHNSCVHHLVKGHHQLAGQRGRCDLPYTHNYHQTYTMASSNPVPVTEL
ncbi:hypothetical protein Pmani_019567 [Petrolisthes manimaculis]|uniref:LRRCT domain-containing protein n=1 Tax=Petrolisthes manimaculis TaxID=1843537 RepID=A0AAE1PJC1_9EUCA|nr:hypothetical protein Pmani_019567 [Petrolisthes manimaculis]